MTLLDMRDKQVEAELREQLLRADQPDPDSPGKVYYGGHHRMQIRDFVEAIRLQRPPFVPAEAARHAVDIVLGTYQSHNSGTWVKLPRPV